MLATLASPSSLGDDGDWAFEMKWDGVRIIAELDHGKVTLRGRRGRDETARYPDVVADLAALPCDRAVLDGEIVVVDPGGAPSFGMLQPRINLTRAADIAAAAASAPAQVMLFDLLSLNGRSLVTQPYQVRRELLESLDPPAGSRVQVPAAFDGDLSAALDASEAFRLEGVVAKRRGSIYEPGRRSPDWLKIKHRHVQAVVVGGWRTGRGNRAARVGALMLGVPGGARPRLRGPGGFRLHRRRAGRGPAAARTAHPADLPVRRGSTRGREGRPLGGTAAGGRGVVHRADRHRPAAGSGVAPVASGSHSRRRGVGGVTGRGRRDGAAARPGGGMIASCGS